MSASYDGTDVSPSRATPGALLVAARDGDLPLVRSLLEQGANIEEKDSSGDTPLNEAARKGHDDVVQFLIKNGAALNVPNQNGKTALQWARDGHYTGVIQILDDAMEDAKQPQEKWVLMSAEKVAFTGTYYTMRKKLTEIFDFANRERVIITDDLRTHAEAMTPAVSFDDLEPDIYEKAFAQFTGLGGHADADFIRHGTRRLNKSKPGLS